MIQEPSPETPGPPPLGFGALRPEELPDEVPEPLSKIPDHRDRLRASSDHGRSAVTEDQLTLTPPESHVYIHVFYTFGVCYYRFTTVYYVVTT